MYGFGPELAAMWLRPQNPFTGLAKRAGLSVRDCELAAAAGGGRLAAIIRIAEQRGGAHGARGGGLPGTVALARIRAREVGAGL